MREHAVQLIAQIDQVLRQWHLIWVASPQDQKEIHWEEINALLDDRFRLMLLRDHYPVTPQPAIA